MLRAGSDSYYSVECYKNRLLCLLTSIDALEGMEGIPEKRTTAYKGDSSNSGLLAPAASIAPQLSVVMAHFTRGQTRCISFILLSLLPGFRVA